MIKDFKKRHKEKLAEIREGETPGDYILLDERFDESGRKFTKPIQKTNVKHLSDLIADLKTQHAQRLAEALAIESNIADHEAIKSELEKLEAAREKKK